jgi:exosortase K
MNSWLAPRGEVNSPRSMWGENRWRIAACVAALTVVVAGKQFYRDASANDLRFILAPTAQLVSWVTGHEFAYEAGQGWINIDVMFVIAPVCAGVNFALAAFLALTLGGLAGMTSLRTTAKRLALAALLAYAGTLVVNTIRISIAVELHRPDIHRAQGIAVYLAGLCGLYALARSIEGRKLRGAYWFAIPLCAYILITLVMPLANGAARRDDFLPHATAVLATCFAVAVLATCFHLIRRKS